MSDSLKDQLLALGLAKQKQNPRKARNVQKKTGPARKSAGDGQRNNAELSLEQAYALKRRDEQSRVDEARKKKQEEDRQRRLLNNAIRDIVKANRLNRDDAEVARNFMFRGRIRKVNVTPEQLKALNSGEMGIAYLSGGYHLLAKKHTDAVRTLSAEHVPDLEAGSSLDDGEHPVPEDLSW
jgi:uncharacterized protein YaiL (DUF2058 family)